MLRRGHGRSPFRSAPTPLLSLVQHGDPFGSSATNTTCLYSIKNYTSTLAHPPLIGYSMDGFPLYGRYLDSTAPGASTALDPCGGHTHSGVAGYHYHSQVVQISSTAGTYLAYPAGPYQCWKGNISAITHFFDTGGGSSNGFTGATGPPQARPLAGVGGQQWRRRR